MHTIKKTVSVLLIISIACSALYFAASIADKEETKLMMSRFLRLHIRANSDSEEDQKLKLDVRNTIISLTTELLTNVSDKEGAISVIRKNFEQISTAAEKTIAENGFKYPVNIKIANEHFDRREYDGFFLPEGYYDSVIVEIGSGKGKNWWCVVFPAVCVSGCAKVAKVQVDNVPEKFRIAQSPVTDDVKYEFWIVKVFKKLFS